MSLRGTFDLALATDWEYDGDFFELIADEARLLGLSTIVISPANLDETFLAFRDGSLDFRVLFDRAASAAPEFAELQSLARGRARLILDPVENLRWAADKATMHLEFLSAGLVTPYTLILPPVRTSPDPGISAADLALVGCPFYIKPANTTGGSLGVIHDAETLADVELARRTYSDDKYLLQERVVPRERDGRRFWFRGFWSYGLVQVAWWNDRTHLYAELAPADVAADGLEPLFDVVRRIAAVCRLGFFSTEVALDGRGRFVVVDYVNEACDMRLQSRHADGVPDAVVRNVACRLAGHVRERLAASGGRSTEGGGT
ncbi:MAG: hypothetical protein OEW05_13050 [Candidatus Aminicenantes bacterium]|nr:hypothetical protein [Candidatus Aminicenantes bacterium]